MFKYNTISESIIVFYNCFIMFILKIKRFPNLQEQIMVLTLRQAGLSEMPSPNPLANRPLPPVPVDSGAHTVPQGRTSRRNSGAGLRQHCGQCSLRRGRA